MNEGTIVKALITLGFEHGWAANEIEGIILWTRDEEQPTEAQLIAAGWIKIESQQETPNP